MTPVLDVHLPHQMLKRSAADGLLSVEQRPEAPMVTAQGDSPDGSEVAESHYSVAVKESVLGQERQHCGKKHARRPETAPSVNVNRATANDGSECALVDTKSASCEFMRKECLAD